MATISMPHAMRASAPATGHCLAFKSSRRAVQASIKHSSARACPNECQSPSTTEDLMYRMAGWSSLAIAGQAASVSRAWAALSSADVTGDPSASVAAPAAGTAAAGLEEVATQNPLETGLFGLAVVALVVVTGGAAYLAITGILDERREKSDRMDYSSKESSKAVKADQDKRRKQKKMPKSKSGRGFS